MAKVRRRNQGKLSYELGWWVNPSFLDDNSTAGWEDVTPHWHDGELVFRLDSNLSVFMEVKVNIWDGHEWTCDKKYKPGEIAGDLSIIVEAKTPQELEAFLAATDLSLYNHLRLPKHRWFADDIYAGYESEWIHRHLNVDADDKEHPAYESVWDLAQWLLLILRKQTDILQHTD